MTGDRRSWNSKFWFNFYWILAFNGNIVDIYKKNYTVLDSNLFII